MGRLGDFTRRIDVPHRLDLHPARRRRAGNKQYDDYVFGAFSGADFHKNAAAQLGRRVSGQFSRNAGDGVFPRTLRRHDRRQRGGKNDCGGGSQSPYGFRQGFRLGGRV